MSVLDPDLSDIDACTGQTQYRTVLAGRTGESRGVAGHPRSRPIAGFTTPCRRSGPSYSAYTQGGEEAPAVSTGERPAVDAVLAGTGRYDDLPDDEQALVREAWAARITEFIASLDLAAEARAGGWSWVDGDATGRPIHRR